MFYFPAGILLQEEEEATNYNRIFQKLGRKNVTQF